MAKILILTGFMGAGKSVVAEKIARKASLEMLDLDDEIERREGRTIAEIFEKMGEKEFRRIENQTLRAALKSGAGVIATGGGLLTTPENAELLKEAVVVNLDAPIEVLIKRLDGSGGKRPLAREGAEALRGLFDRRRSLYEAVLHHVDTANLSIEESAEKALEIWLAEKDRN